MTPSARSRPQLLQHLKRIISDLCKLYNLPQHPDVEMLDQPLPAEQVSGPGRPRGQRPVSTRARTHTCPGALLALPDTYRVVALGALSPGEALVALPVMPTHGQCLQVERKGQQWVATGDPGPSLRTNSMASV